MRRTTSQFPLLYSSITEPIDSSNYNFVNEIEMLGYDDTLSDILIEIGNQQIANLLPNQECFNTQLSENDLNGWEVEMENFLNLDSVSDTLEESVKIENKNNSVKRTKAETKRLENEMIEKEKKERAKRLEEKKKNKRYIRLCIPILCKAFKIHK